MDDGDGSCLAGTAADGPQGASHAGTDDADGCAGCGQASDDRAVGRATNRTVSMGPRRVNVFWLSDGWRGLDMDEAKRRVKLARLPTPPRQISAPPKPVRQAQVEQPVEQPPPRAVPSMPAVAWIGR